MRSVRSIPIAMDSYLPGNERRQQRESTPEYMVQAKAYFERALMLDAAQVESPVAIAAVDSLSGRISWSMTAPRCLRQPRQRSPRRSPCLRSTPAGMLVLGCGAQGANQARGARHPGSASCHWRWIKTPPMPTVSSVSRRFSLAAARKPRLISRKRFGFLPAISSPSAGCIMSAWRGRHSATMLALLRGCADRSRQTGIIRLRISSLRHRLRCSVRWEEAWSQTAGSSLNPAFTLRRTRGRMSDDPTYRAGARHGTRHANRRSSGELKAAGNRAANRA